MQRISRQTGRQTNITTTAASTTSTIKDVSTYLYACIDVKNYAHLCECMYAFAYRYKMYAYIIHMHTYTCVSVFDVYSMSRLAYIF